MAAKNKKMAEHKYLLAANNNPTRIYLELQA